MNDRPVAIVTGAGAGIGRAVALELARRTHDLALAGRTRAPLEETAALARALGARSAVIPADVAVAAHTKRLVEQALREFGRIDALVNNAGAAPNVPIERTTPELLREVFAVNTFGAADLILAVWPTMTAQRRGCIVNVSSLASLDPFPGFFAYAGAKAALNLFTRSCASEGKAHNIRAFSVAPGAVETAMLRAAFDETIVPPSLALAPEDVARIVAACIAGERDEDNGRTIFVMRSGAEVRSFIEPRRD